MTPESWILTRTANGIVSGLALIASAVLLTPIALLAILPFIG